MYPSRQKTLLRWKNVSAFLSFIQQVKRENFPSCQISERPFRINGYIFERDVVFTALNRVTLLGRVGVDPQLRGSERSPVAVFTLATNSNYV